MRNFIFVCLLFSVVVGSRPAISVRNNHARIGCLDLPPFQCITHIPFVDLHSGTLSVEISDGEWSNIHGIRNSLSMMTYVTSVIQSIKDEERTTGNYNVKLDHCDPRDGFDNKTCIGVATMGDVGDTTRCVGAIETGYCQSNDDCHPDDKCIIFNAGDTIELSGVKRRWGNQLTFNRSFDAGNGQVAIEELAVNALTVSQEVDGVGYCAPSCDPEDSNSACSYDAPSRAYMGCAIDTKRCIPLSFGRLDNIDENNNLTSGRILYSYTDAYSASASAHNWYSSFDGIEYDPDIIICDETLSSMSGNLANMDVISRAPSSASSVISHEFLHILGAGHVDDTKTHDGAPYNGCNGFSFSLFGEPMETCFPWTRGSDGETMSSLHGNIMSPTIASGDAMSVINSSAIDDAEYQGEINSRTQRGVVLSKCSVGDCRHGQSMVATSMYKPRFDCGEDFKHCALLSSTVSVGSPLGELIHIQDMEPSNRILISEGSIGFGEGLWVDVDLKVDSIEWFSDVAVSRDGTLTVLLIEGLRDVYYDRGIIDAGEPKKNLSNSKLRDHIVIYNNDSKEVSSILEVPQITRLKTSKRVEKDTSMMRGRITWVDSMNAFMIVRYKPTRENVYQFDVVFRMVSGDGKWARHEIPYFYTYDNSENEEMWRDSIVSNGFDVDCKRYSESLSRCVFVASGAFAFSKMASSECMESLDFGSRNMTMPSEHFGQLASYSFFASNNGPLGFGQSPVGDVYDDGLVDLQETLLPGYDYCKEATYRWGFSEDEVYTGVDSVKVDGAKTKFSAMSSVFSMPEGKNTTIGTFNVSVSDSRRDLITEIRICNDASDCVDETPFSGGVDFVLQGRDIIAPMWTGGTSIR